jgi:hypothetical protein
MAGRRLGPLVEHGHPERGLQAAEAWAGGLGPVPGGPFPEGPARWRKWGGWRRRWQSFRALVRDHPDDATLLNFLGYTLVERGLDAREALPLLQKAALLTPSAGPCGTLWAGPATPSESGRRRGPPC